MSPSASVRLWTHTHDTCFFVESVVNLKKNASKKATLLNICGDSTVTQHEAGFRVSRIKHEVFYARGTV